MADNTQLPIPATLGDIIRTEDIGGSKFQAVKIALGAAGVNDGDVSASNPMPVEIQGALGSADTKSLGTGLADGDVGLITNTVIHGKTTAGGGSFVDVKVTPSGAMAVSVGDSALPTGAATETTLAALNTKIPALGQALMASSFPVVIASNQSAIPVSLPDMVLSSYNQAGVIAINTDLLVIDCRGFEAVSIQCVSMGTTGVVTPAWSNDATNYTNATLLNQAGATVTTFNGPNFMTTPVLGRYLRLRLTTATTAGTTNIQVQGITRAANLPVPAQPISGTITANIGTGSIAAGTNAIGDVGVQYRANATGAASRAKLISANTTNPTVVKASAGRLMGWSLANTTASWVYVKLHNIATTPTAGTTAVVEAIGIPPNGKSEIVLEGGISFGTGIALTTTTGAADADATAVGLNAIVGGLYFQ